MKTPYFARYKDGTRIEVLRQDATHVECVNAGPDGPAVWRTALANITPEQPEATEPEDTSDGVISARAARGLISEALGKEKRHL